MAKIQKYSLQRTMIVYFLLIGFASLLVGVEFVLETDAGTLRNDLLTNFERYAAHEIDRSEVFGPIDHLRNKAVLMIGIILCVILIVLTMFIRNVTEPLQHMIEVAREISGGNLRPTINIRARNELSDLGNVINEMASNIQEIIMLSDNICVSSEKHLAVASTYLAEPSLSGEALITVRREVEHLQDEMKMMREMVEFFRYYLGEDTHV